MDQASSPVVRARSKKTWLWVVLTVLGVVIVVGGLLAWWVMGGFAGNPKKAANEWLTELSSNQVEQAYNETSTAFKEGTSSQAFQTFLDAYPIMTNVDKVDFTGIERASGNGQTLETLTGTLTGKDGATSPVEIILIKEDGNWKIYNVDLRGLSN